LPIKASDTYRGLIDFAQYMHGES